jgi:hypothetical protein
MAKLASLEVCLRKVEFPCYNSRWGSVRRPLLLSASAVALAAALNAGMQLP